MDWGGADLPLEYHLLDRRPTRWEPIDAIHLLHRMGLTLAFNDAEIVRQAAAEAVGDSAADALFPINSPIQEPIVPVGPRRPTGGSRWSMVDGQASMVHGPLSILDPDRLDYRPSTIDHRPLTVSPASAPTPPTTGRYPPNAAQTTTLSSPAIHISS